MRNYSLGVSSTKTCHKRNRGRKGETEEGKEKHGGRKREWELEATTQDALKETKALSF